MSFNYKTLPVSASDVGESVGWKYVELNELSGSGRSVVVDPLVTVLLLPFVFTSRFTTWLLAATTFSTTINNINGEILTLLAATITESRCIDNTFRRRLFYAHLS